MILIGGSLLIAGDRLLERAQAFVAAVHESAAELARPPAVTILIPLWPRRRFVPR